LATATLLPGDRTWTVNRDALGSPTSVTDPEGRTTRYASDAYGRVGSRTWGGATTLYRYDDSSSGELARVEEPHENGTAVTAIERDARGHPDGIVDPARQRTELSANELGWVFEETIGRDERQRSVAYLLTGDVARETVATGAGSLAGTVVRDVEYSGAGLPIGVTTSGDGESAVTLDRDGAGRLTGVRSATGRGAAYELDGLGRVTGVIVPDAGRSEFEYDANDNVTAVVSAAGRRETRDYNGRRARRDHRSAWHDPASSATRPGASPARRCRRRSQWQRLGWSYNRATRSPRRASIRFALDGSGGGDV
jgi:YD repeat-containing protein